MLNLIECACGELALDGICNSCIEYQEKANRAPRLFYSNNDQLSENSALVGNYYTQRNENVRIA